MLFWAPIFFGRKAFLPAASFATRLLFLTGETSGFPRNAPFPCPAPGSRQQSCHAPGWPRFLSSRLARSPSGNRGAARYAAGSVEGRKRKRKVVALAPASATLPRPVFSSGQFSRGLCRLSPVARVENREAWQIRSAYRWHVPRTLPGRGPERPSLG